MQTRPPTKKSDGPNPNINRQNINNENNFFAFPVSFTDYRACTIGVLSIFAADVAEEGEKDTGGQGEGKIHRVDPKFASRPSSLHWKSLYEP